MNSDYISDALAAQVGGIGIAPGATSATASPYSGDHGTAPLFAGKDRVNPGSLILSAEMMLRYLGWTEAADLVLKGVRDTIAAKELTFDLALLRKAIARPSASSHRSEEEIQKLIRARRSQLLVGDAVIRHM